MSVADVEVAVRLIAKRPASVSFAGERDEALLRAAEEALGLQFPPSYRLFLRRLGAGNVGSFEVYGVIDRDFQVSAVPDAIWMTLRGREQWALPPSMVVVYFDGAGDYYVVDTARSSPSGESPMVVWRPGYSQNADAPEVVADDFGTFFLDITKRALDVA